MFVELCYFLIVLFCDLSASIYHLVHHLIHHLICLVCEEWAACHTLYVQVHQLQHYFIVLSELEILWGAYVLAGVG